MEKALSRLCTKPRATLPPRPALPPPSFANAPSGDQARSSAAAAKNAPTGDQTQSLADAIKNNQDLGNARTSALHVLLFVCAAEGSVDATKFIKDNKVDDGADHDDAKVFHDAAYTFSQLNGGVPKGASEQNVLDRFRTGLNWDLGNHTSAPNVASEWDIYLFAEDPKGQGYHSVVLQVNFEQAGEQATKNLDNGVERTATEYHYVGTIQPKTHVSNPQIHEGDGNNTVELWLEQPGDTPPDTVNEEGVRYTLEKGSDGKPVSRQQTVRDMGAVNQAIAKALGPPRTITNRNTTTQATCRMAIRLRGWPNIQRRRSFIRNPPMPWYPTIRIRRIISGDRVSPLTRRPSSRRKPPARA